jgi:hypothetical protein
VAAEVLLIADGEPVVFARSLVAATTIPAAWHLLHGLGGRPLAAVLFDDPRVRRSPWRRPAWMPAIRWHHAAAPPAGRSAGPVGAPFGLSRRRRAAARSPKSSCPRSGTWPHDDLSLSCSACPNTKS